MERDVFGLAGAVEGGKRVGEKLGAEGELREWVFGVFPGGGEEDAGFVEEGVGVAAGGAIEELPIFIGGGGEEVAVGLVVSGKVRNWWVCEGTGGGGAGVGEDVEIEREGGDGGRGVVGRGEEPDAGGERRGEVEGGGVEFGERDFGGGGLLEGAAIAGDGGEADIEGFAAVEDAPGGAGNFGEHGCFREEDQAGSERDVAFASGEALGEEHVFPKVLEGEASFAGFAGAGGGCNVSAGGADGDLRCRGGALKPIGEQLG